MKSLFKLSTQAALLSAALSVFTLGSAMAQSAPWHNMGRDATAAEVKVYQTQDEANQDLAAGRIDATQADSIAMDAFLATDAGKACCAVVGAVADDPAILGAGVGAGLRKGEDELKAKINAGIAKILEDGTYEAITKGYFASSIYGG